ncbi:MAG: type I DNA topoisomerase [Clostridia bacterium]|nr:type I DNA topoisomerase [Clostridia bacterium]
MSVAATKKTSTAKKKSPAKKSAGPKKNLVIVESPSKAKTIGKFLGSNYKVVASVGHVRDLPKSKLGIDIENDFEPNYISIRGKGDIIKELRKEAKSAGKIYLATDPDREGEAISWHLAFLLGIDVNSPCRIVFNEITKKAIQAAVKNPRAIDLKLVDAQQARRVLDRLVGYQISPLLWQKIGKGLSAGRVQSVTLKILCEREKQIQAFEPQEYWTVSAAFEKKDAGRKKSFTAKLNEYKGKKITVGSKKENDEILAKLRQSDFIVKNIEEKERTKKAYAPFTTSSLQQDASTKLGFLTKRTMLVAQQLYEGVQVKGHGTIGLISYIRTDSVRLSDEARTAAKSFITENYGAEFWSNNVYSNKKKDVQDAHEAIRPSYVDLKPDDIKDSLTADQFKLYRLIWTRFIASQMSPATYNSVAADIENGDYTFRANGSKLKFEGFMKVYISPSDDAADKLLPALEKGEVLVPADVKGEQNFTQPPARYTEASLIKELEEKDIGRPSTYSPIISNITEKRYVTREKKTLIPTELGFIVTDLMGNYFKEIVDVGFTADLENKLDKVEVDDVEWKNLIRDFYKGFRVELEVAEKEIEKMSLEPEFTGENCELCGKPMVIRHGRFGDFIACSGYPECKNTKAIVKKTGVICPDCGGDIIEKRSARGKLFFGCSGYPSCKNSYWYRPIQKECPKCGALLVEKKWKEGRYSCSNMECDYKE